jgi:HEAT repeat protein
VQYSGVKPLSPRVLELLDSLKHPPAPLDRLTGRSNADLRVLADLQSHPEPAIAPYLLPYLVGPQKVVCATARVLARVIDSATPDDLLELDEVCRCASAYRAAWQTGWQSMTPVEASRYETLGADEWVVVGMASFHWNGFVREAAVTRLDLLDDRRVLPFLLIRLNDWVLPVAQRAAVAVERRIAREYAAAFLANLSIIERLASRKRRDHTRLLDHVRALLEQPEQRHLLIEGMRSPERRTRRFSVQLALQRVAEDTLDVVRLALADSDTVIRHHAVSRMSESLGDLDLSRVLPKALADPYSLVRREAVAVAASQRTDEAKAYLIDALLDPSETVRDVARFYLRRRGEMTDFAAEYRARLGNDAIPRTVAAALSGLGETGTREDVSVAVEYLRHARASVRRAAVRTIGILDGDAQLPILIQALRDPSVSVSRVARDQLYRRVNLVIAEVQDVFRSEAAPHVRRHALLLLSALGKWDSLPVLLEGVADANVEINTMARARLDAWIGAQNRSMAQPSDSQLQAIRLAFGRYETSLSRMAASEVTSLLRFWGRSAS